MQNNSTNRANIFKAFDSLKGFRECLAAKERIIVPRKVLSEDDYEDLDYKIKQVHKGMMVKIVYYENGEYIEKIGMVSNIDIECRRKLQIVEKIINLDDIVRIELI